MNTSVPKIYIPRAIESKIKGSTKFVPVIAMMGPRQSGKTTLAKHLFPDYLYVNLEFPDIRLMAENDPRFFLSQSKHMIIDEIQRIPDLFSYIQGLVDEDDERKYILTGSNNFKLLHSISQSLAGRVSFFTILPFSIEEVRKANIFSTDLYENIFRGWYPRVVALHNNPEEWYQGYIQTYLEKDVRDMSSIHMIEQFYTFLQVLATHAGNALNYTTVAKEVGVSPNTIRGWISILEASYIVYKLRPYHSNIKKRLVKSSKIYFYDTGLLCSLLSIKNKEDLSAHPFIGALFENFIVSEYIKKQSIDDSIGNLFYFRDVNGNEVDLILNSGKTFSLFEIKLGKVFKTEFLKGINFFNKEVKLSESSSIIYGGDISHKVKDINLISWKDVIN